MITLYNPHSQDFIFKPLAFILAKRKPLCKYGYIKDILLENKGFLDIYVDYTESSIIPMKVLERLPLFLRKIFINIELFFWLRVNNIENKVKFISKKDDLSKYNLFGFSYKLAVNNLDNKLSELKKFNKVYMHLSHYMIRTREKFDFFKQLNNITLLGDNDCTQNSYYQDFLGNSNINLKVVSFIPQDRFFRKINFEERSLKIIATGSFHNLYEEKPPEYYEDFLKFFNLSTYHFIRKEIFEDNQNEKITSYVKPYRENSKKKLDISQKKYFSFDIVEAYNKHKFAVVGDEITGFIAIGSLEAMACGCVVFCVKESVQGLEMIEYEHYLPYDGTYKDLITQYEKYKNDENLISNISKNAICFIKRLKEKNKNKIIELSQ